MSISSCVVHSTKETGNIYTGFSLGTQLKLSGLVTSVTNNKSCHICSMRLKRTLAKYEKYGTLSINLAEILVCNWNVTVCYLIKNLFFSVVFIFGGYDGSRICEGTWRLNLDTLEWRRLPHDLPQPVYFNAAAISPVKFWSIFKWLISL